MSRIHILALWLATIFENAQPRSAAIRTSAAFNQLINIRDGRVRWFPKLLLAELGFAACLVASIVSTLAAGQHGPETLRVAVYDVPPYGYVDTDGSISGVSVDLWRRVAEQMEWSFRLIPVSDMEAILIGLEQGRFDAAIGAITITPERAARVDFSYPAHRSGVGIALQKKTGPIFALTSYWIALSELSPLIVVILAMLTAIGIVMWIVERRGRSTAQGSESSVVSLRDGLYWAVVTMTTVKHFLEPEHGAAAVEAMRAIKHALDPSNIMNPGKIV